MLHALNLAVKLALKRYPLVALLAFLFVTVVVGVIAMTKAQRRIPTQSAKHVRGRRVYGGTRQFLPLRVNQAGVMPVIFASSLLLIPMFLFSGTFFPVSRLPLPLEWLAYATPLWHGVDLCRELTLGNVHLLRALGHVAYLLLFVIAGLVWAERTYKQRLFN